ncbi:MAG: amino acid ABC transporter substrate-binding protein [Deltaproteobacteria bacterium]|nr:amino acid ABC transporter substrate-binding protein [Deltaproteobacteria bacterium]
MINKTKQLLKLAIFFLILITGCHKTTSPQSSQDLTFGVSAEYPPFEFQQKGVLKGFDVELAQRIAKELGVGARFENMQFSTILPALDSAHVDVAISTIAITEERLKNFDFSDSYYTESLAIVFPAVQPIKQASHLAIEKNHKKKIACQLGTTMEIWLRKNAPDVDILSLDNNNLAIEALKAGHVDGVFMDSVQASVFSQKNMGLSYAVIASSDNGYGMALKKGSPLKSKINAALKTLEKSGELEQLQKKWLQGDISWAM